MSIFSKPADMFLAKPKRFLAVYQDNTMPRRDWSKLDEPAAMRVNVARLRIERARKQA